MQTSDVDRQISILDQKNSTCFFQRKVSKYLKLEVLKHLFLQKIRVKLLTVFKKRIENGMNYIITNRCHPVEGI